MSEIVDGDMKLMAAVAYGEASVANDTDEIGGVAFAVANRCRLWGKTVSELKKIDSNYAYAWGGKNERFNLFEKAAVEKVKSDRGMRCALEWAQKAMDNEATDPSNGALWWDGLDLKTNFQKHAKVLATFKWGDPSHNIFGLEENPKLVVVNWVVVDKRTGKRTETTERGRYDSHWVSTAAHGSTVFWRLNPDYIKATGAKEYK